MIQLKTADWNALWKNKFKYGTLDGWALDIAESISKLCKLANPKVLSAGCGRGLIDYWLMQNLNAHVTLLDSSEQCIENLQQSFSNEDPNKYKICLGTIFEIPFLSRTFDITWNEGVLEHFSEEDYRHALLEMTRVSNRLVLVDVPYACCRPYVLVKKWLEDHDMWSWGYEDPKTTQIPAFLEVRLDIVSERAIGNKKTIENYVNMIPEEHRHEITDQLSHVDYTIFPHLLTIGIRRD